MNKKFLSYLLAMVLTFSSLVMPVYAEELDKDADAIIYVDANTVLESDYRGVGVQWDPSDPTIRDYTAEEWQMITERLDFMKPPIVRSIFQARWYARPSTTTSSSIEYYWENEDAEGNNSTWLGEDGQVSNEMKRMYAILDYCQANDIEVIFGEWAKSDQYPLEMTSTTDPKWAEMIVECLDYLINVKGYTCIKYYNFINEPNWDWGISDDEGSDKWSIWAIGVTQLHNKMLERGLGDQVKIIGPDTTGGDNWIDLVAQNLGHIVDTYDVHKYASFNDVLSGGIEEAVAAKKEDYQTKDPYGGENKQYIMGEAGLTDGKTENDQQPNVREFIYGVHMSDYTIQTMRGGQAGIIMWDLDDSMHRKDAYDENSPLKVWGFWNSLSEYNEQDLRPWFYPISLMANYFPRGSEILYTTKSGDSYVRATAAKIADGNGKYDLSFAVVNNQDESRKINLMVPAAEEVVTFNVYQYYDGDMKTNAEGYPVVSETVTNVDLANGYEITMPSRGTVILTTLEGGSSISLDPTAEIPDIPDEASMKDYRYSISDDLADWSKVESHSDGWAFDNGNVQYFEGDSTRIKRTWDAEQDVVYKLEDINDFTARVYYDPGVIAFDNTVKFYSSPDGMTWSELAITMDTPLNTGDGWHRVNFKPAAGVPEGTGYLKILFLPDGDSGNDSNSWTPQLAYVNITREVLKDDIENYDKMYDHGSFMFDDSNAHYFHGDTTRIKRAEDSDQSVIYRMKDMGDFKIRVYYENYIDGKVKFEVSSDGESWTDLKTQHGEEEFAAEIWYGTTFTPDESLPIDTNYLKITFLTDGNPWQPQLTDVMIIPARMINDQLYDTSQLYAYSDGWQVDQENTHLFDDDEARLKRGWDGSEEVIYNLANLSSFKARVYFDPDVVGIDDTVKIYTSSDAVTWSELGVDHDEPTSTSDNWYKTNYTPAESIPEGSNFLKIEFYGDGSKEGNAWSPQLGEVKVISGETEDHTPPTIPTNLNATYGATHVDLTWDPSTDNIELKEYRIYDGDEQVATSTEPSIKIENLKPESEHAYTVKAVDASGNISDASEIVRVTMRNLVSIDEVEFMDYKGNIVDSLEHLEFVRAEIKITNNNFYDTSATTILALYNTKNQLERISFIEKELKVGETLSMNAGFDLPQNTKGYKVKAFVWDSLMNMEPLSYTYEITNN
ncbi:fibronectin type III domain-containing protein [Vallitalea okinawensis]|uniref:fibronectin type III domain-containing protein n=1 Tax=Vallitalea okinawensis TaxID=2078660 RepID=UPI000CFBA48A|nr:fibronectin type III domain-containing protein [Vallitalea okinawensis]